MVFKFCRFRIRLFRLKFTKFRVFKVNFRRFKIENLTFISLNLKDLKSQILLSSPIMPQNHNTIFSNINIFKIKISQFRYDLKQKLTDSFYFNFSCWTYWFLLLVYFLYLGFGAWMFVLLERPTEEDKCEFVNEFSKLYVNAGEEYVWTK